MKEFTYTVTDPLGIHIRSAGLLAKAAKAYSDTTVTVTLTVNTNSKVNLSLSGFSLSGADLQSAVKNNALTNYTAGTDLTSLTYGDAYKFVLKNLNNTQYKYELTPDTAEDNAED